MPKSEVCEALSGGRWTRLGVEEALERRGTTMRCLECHGPVRPHKKGSTGQAAHFEHPQRHPGCSLSAAWDGVTRSRHPGALA